MNAYMVYDRIAGPQVAAALAFAHTVQEARKVSWPIMGDWTYGEWIDVTARLLRDRPWLFKQADPEKLAADVAHVIESPITCKGCEMWGDELNDRGLCEACADEEE